MLIVNIRFEKPPKPSLFLFFTAKLCDIFITANFLELFYCVFSKLKSTKHKITSGHHIDKIRTYLAKFFINSASIFIQKIFRHRPPTRINKSRR